MQLKILLLSVMLCSLLGCKVKKEVETTCEAVNAESESPVTAVARSIPSGGKAAQYFRVFATITISEVMVKLNTNGLTSLAVTIVKGNPYSNPDFHPVLATVTVTTGLTNNTLREVWIPLDSDLELPPLPTLEEPQEQYAFIVSASGAFAIEYGTHTNSYLRSGFTEFNFIWDPIPPDIYGGMTMGIKGSRPCFR